MGRKLKIGGRKLGVYSPPLAGGGGILWRPLAQLVSSATYVGLPVDSSLVMCHYHRLQFDT